MRAKLPRSRARAPTLPCRTGTPSPMTSRYPAREPYRTGMLDLGDGHPVRIGKWAHLPCLNARLHPAHIVQGWRSDPEAVQAEVKRLLGRRDSDD